ncbi:MAG TPA: EamA family transporter [Ramlibacter sp.]|nr:EamA family transporter [Ramlibacter sp.]
MNQSTFSRRDLASALAVVVIWGLNFVAMKIALHHFTPFQLGAARYVFAALPLALVLRRPRVAPRWLLFYGLCQGVGQFGFLFLALKVGMTAALASVLMQTQVFFTALLAFALLGERLTRAQKGGLGLAAVALLCFAMNYVAPAGAAVAATTALGFVLNLGAALMWGASNIVARRVQQETGGRFDATAFVVWSSITPIVPFIVASLVFDDPALRWQWTAAPWSTWAAVAYLGWVATIAGYALWTALLKRHPANRVAPFSLGVPVVGLSAGMLALGEVITAWQWLGIGFVVAALLSVFVLPQLSRRT